MLDPFSRSAIVALSALCVAGTVALAPVRARSSIEEMRLQPAAIVVHAPPDTVTLVPIRRDPFAQPVAPALPAVAAEPASSVRGAVERLPSNLTSDSIPALPGAAPDPLAGGPRVTAIVTGAHPYAMIETGSLHEIKGIGDLVEGIAIVSIDLAGIRLQNGRHFSVDAAGRL